MVNLYHLEQFIVVAQTGNLSLAAEQFHISQPALSKSMQKLENELHVCLFKRYKNKLELTEIGKAAVPLAQKLLEDAQKMEHVLLELQSQQQVFSVGSCSPTPSSLFQENFQSQYPQMELRWELQTESALLDALLDGVYQMILTTAPIHTDGVFCRKYGTESLYLVLEPDHPLSHLDRITFSQLNGQFILVAPNLGMFQNIFSQHLPDSRLVLQTKQQDFEVLRTNSNLPSFTTDFALRATGIPKGKILVPLSGLNAQITYYCSYRKKHLQQVEALLDNRLGTPNQPT